MAIRLPCHRPKQSHTNPNWKYGKNIFLCLIIREVGLISFEDKLKLELQTDSPLFEDEEDGGDHHKKTDDVVPLEVFLEIDNGKHAKDYKRDDFLNGLKLGGGKGVRADAVGGDLKTVLNKRDGPTDENDPVRRRGLVF